MEKQKKKQQIYYLYSMAQSYQSILFFRGATIRIDEKIDFVDVVIDGFVEFGLLYLEVSNDSVDSLAAGLPDDVDLTLWKVGLDQRANVLDALLVERLLVLEVLVVGFARHVVPDELVFGEDAEEDFGGEDHR